MKIKQPEFNLLYSDFVTRLDYNRITDNIRVRLSEIVSSILPHFDFSRDGWWDYNNCDLESSEVDVDGSTRMNIMNSSKLMGVFLLLNLHSIMMMDTA